ncbi:uncharacterized protein LOC126610984 isoform X2 [Malus sylvestris]|uniref:uncharacterized protein LOC126610984 isoform X2 n=1 Tax=Malus sylvestris TaxID=3752 RepID=UPI0021AD4130|nr:uncharacterized protein LOC126610984 isoform X2 [Malus sylvestris]
MKREVPSFHIAMSRQAQALLSLLLLATCAATGLADAPPPPFSTIPGLFPPGIPGLSSPISPGEIAKCWSSLQNVPGCASEIYPTILTGKFALGPACCKALVEVDKNCLRKLFPLFPSIPAVLKSSCTTAAAPKAARSKQ